MIAHWPCSSPKHDEAGLRSPFRPAASHRRGATPQARTATLLRQLHVEIVALDDNDARRVGLLLAATSTTDVVDAHVALCGHRMDRPVLTSDPDVISRLAPGVRIQRV